MSEKLLREKCKNGSIDLEDKLVHEKAKGLSSAIDSALHYWNIKEESLNAKVLSRYYAFLQFTIAEEVASIRNKSDLKEAQKHTEQGHGLSTLNKYEESDFLENYYCYFRNDGHFFYYLQQVGIDKSEKFFLPKRLRVEDSIEGIDVISLADLFRRIPELQNVIEEYIGKCPLVLHIGLDFMKNHEKEELRRETHSKRTGTFQFFAPPEAEDEIVTPVAIYPSSENMTIEYVQKLKTPFTTLKETVGKTSDSKFISCDFKHKNEGLWWNSIDTYKSSYCATSYIIPLFGKINDPIIINYSLMYTLSIIVRYMPDIWYEITVGKLSNIGNLIDYYISIFDHIIPLQMLERITEKRLQISAPDGFNAPV